MQEYQVDRTHRAIALLGDNKLGQSPQVLAVAIVYFFAEDEAHQIGERLCRNGPLAVRKVKESVVRGLGMPMAQAFQEELRLATEVYASADAVEGPAAFAEKREPRFQGR